MDRIKILSSLHATRYDFVLLKTPKAIAFFFPIFFYIFAFPRLLCTRHPRLLSTPVLDDHNTIWKDILSEPSKITRYIITTDTKFPPIHIKQIRLCPP